jgi:hypothetical protein
MVLKTFNKLLIKTKKAFPLGDAFFVRGQNKLAFHYQLDIGCIKAFHLKMDKVLLDIG